MLKMRNFRDNYYSTITKLYYLVIYLYTYFFGISTNPYRNSPNTIKGNLRIDQ